MLDSILPITAVIAILLFIAREAIDYVKRRRADLRKFEALKIILARECELNNWTAKQLKRVFQHIIGKDGEQKATIEVGKKDGGERFIKVSNGDGTTWIMHVIPSVHRDVMSKVFLDVAVINPDFFKVVEQSYDSLAELLHIRDMLLHSEDRQESMGQAVYMVGLAEYAIEQMVDIQKNLTSLYTYCTGKHEMSIRIR